MSKKYNSYYDSYDYWPTYDYWYNSYSWKQEKAKDNWWWNWWSSFSYWSDYFSKYTSWFADKEKIREYKQKIKDICKKEFIPLQIYTWVNTTWIAKQKKMILSISDNDFSKLNNDDKINSIPNIYNKIPYNAWYIWNKISTSHMLWKNIIPDWISKVSNEDTLLNIDLYFDWTISKERLFDIFDLDALDKFEKEQEIQTKINEDWTMVSYDNIWKEDLLSNLTLSKQFSKLIKSKIHVRDLTNKDSSLRKWKRINRDFILWTSYKPLITKDIIKRNKKNLFFIVDCSWSMWDAKMYAWCHYSYPYWWPAYMSVSFLDALLKTDLFNINYIYFHSSWWYGNVIKKFKKTPFSCCWWWEWFERIDTNLDHSELQWIDYVITLTDLNIDQASEKWLYNFLSKWKKHLTLSFERKWTLKWANVRTIKSPHDIVNSLITLLS